MIVTYNPEWLNQKAFNIMREHFDNIFSVEIYGLKWAVQTAYLRFF